MESMRIDEVPGHSEHLSQHGRVDTSMNVVSILFHLICESGEELRTHDLGAMTADSYSWGILIWELLRARFCCNINLANPMKV